jgi:adenylylsulfate kinase
VLGFAVEMTELSDIPVLLITGPVGVGKTTVADEVSLILEARGKAHSNIDMDTLRQVFPRPPDDPYAERVGLAALAAVWQIHQEAGAEVLVIPTVVESNAVVDKYRAAIPGSVVSVIRLTATGECLRARIEHRGTDVEWSIGRATDLEKGLESADLQAAVLDTSDLRPSEVAIAVLDAVGW